MKKFSAAVLLSSLLLVGAHAPAVCSDGDCDEELVCSQDSQCEPCQCVGRPLGRCKLEPARGK